MGVWDGYLEQLEPQFIGPDVPKGPQGGTDRQCGPHVDVLDLQERARRAGVWGMSG